MMDSWQQDSLWDTLPLEMRRHILSFAGPLTRFLCGMLGPPESLDAKTVTALWRDAMAIDWQGDLAALPDTRLDFYSLVGVRSRPFYERLCARFPKQDCRTINARCDAMWNEYNIHRAEYVIGDGRVLFQLRHAPMRQCWLELLDLSFPIALGWYALQFGHVDLLRRLASELQLIDLARFGRVVIDPIGVDFQAMDCAAADGHKDMVIMLHEAGNTSCTVRAMNDAAAFGSLETVQWLHAHRSEGCTTAAMDTAAGNGHLDVVQWLHANRTEGCTKAAMDRAAKEGHLSIVRFLHENRSEGCTTYAMDKAAAYGHLDVLQFLVRHRSEGCTDEALTWAMLNGHTSTVAFLVESCGQTPSKDGFIAVAKTGNKDVVQCLMLLTPPDVLTPDWIVEALAAIADRESCLALALYLADHISAHPPLLAAWNTRFPQ